MARVVIPINEVKNTAASLTTALTGTNNDLTFTALATGPEGNSIRVVYVVAGASTPLTVTTSGLDITVNVATNGSSVATSTAAQVKAALDANPIVALLMTTANAGADNGTGVVTALSITALAGGSLGIVQPAQVTADATNNHYFGPNDGRILLEVVSSDGGAQSVTIKAPAAGAAAGTYTDRVEPVAAGATRILGPFTSARHNQDNVNQQVYVNPSVATTLKFRAYKLVRTA